MAVTAPVKMTHKHKMTEDNSHPRRLAVFLPDLVGAGAQRVCLNLANGIAARGYPVDVVVVKAEGSYLAQLSPQIRLIDLKAERAIGAFRPLRHYLQTVKPDTMLTAIHVNFIALWVKRLSRTSTKVVVSQHINATTYSAGAADLRVRVEPALIRLFYPWAEEIIAVSQGVAESLNEASGLTPQALQVIYNPVIMPDMAEQKAQTPNHPWFASGEPPVVLGVGRLDEQKGFDLLIEAFQRIADQTNARLMILGEGALRPQLEEQIRRYGLKERIQLPGFTENPYAYMAHAGLFVLSSRFEGLPTVLVEALYCDTPVVSTDCPNGPREILDGGRYGHLVPPGDATALAEAIRDALNGGAIHAPAASWRPYVMDTVLDQYIDALGLRSTN